MENIGASSWIELNAEYTVTFNANTGSGSMGPQTISYNVSSLLNPNALLYAQWEKNPTKYVVQIYGIYQDEDWAGTVSSWWMRSLYLNNTYNSNYIYTSGSTSYNGTVNKNYGISFGFCIDYSKYVKKPKSVLQ